MKLTPVFFAALFALTLAPISSMASVDLDGDGVPDDRDECPQTPAKTSIDKRGCPLKTEAAPEIVPVAQEITCATPPAGAVVDNNGCAVDQDADGVPDGVDQCAHTAQGLTVNAAGCPLPVAKETPAPKPAKKKTPKKITEPLPAIPDATPMRPAAEHSAPETVAIPVQETMVAPMAVPPPPQPEPVPVPAVESAKPEAALSKPTGGAEASVAAQQPIVAKPVRTPRVPKPPLVAAKPLVIEAASSPATSGTESARPLAIHFTAGSAELSPESLRKLSALASEYLAALSSKPTLRIDLQAHANATHDGGSPEEVAGDRLDIIRVYLIAHGVAKEKISLSTHVDKVTSAEAQRESRRAEIKLVE